MAYNRHATFRFRNPIALRPLTLIATHHRPLVVGGDDDYHLQPALPTPAIAAFLSSTRIH
ncbi:hypothetical protein TMatcc_003626 [Talaromyces marneffei ATCC 18224]